MASLGAFASIILVLEKEDLIDLETLAMAFRDKADFEGFLTNECVVHSSEIQRLCKSWVSLREWADASVRSRAKSLAAGLKQNRNKPDPVSTTPVTEPIPLKLAPGVRTWVTPKRGSPVAASTVDAQDAQAVIVGSKFCLLESCQTFRMTCAAHRPPHQKERKQIAGQCKCEDTA